MNKTLGIIQPGRIGDLIISLPIAKYYHDRGYKVVWPIAAPFVKSFSFAADYVQFIPVRHSHVSDTTEWHKTSEWILNQFDCDKKLDLLFNMTDTEVASRGWKESKLNWDEYRYKLAEVPFDEKWNLVINRNKERELRLYDTVVKQDKYIVAHTQASAVRRTIELSQEILSEYQVVNLTQITDNIFDWTMVLEKAAKLILIDSCFANLVEQLGIGGSNKVLLHKGQDFALPIMRSKWRVV